MRIEVFVKVCEDAQLDYKLVGLVLKFYVATEQNSSLSVDEVAKLWQLHVSLARKYLDMLASVDYVKTEYVKAIGRPRIYLRGDKLC